MYTIIINVMMVPVFVAKLLFRIKILDMTISILVSAYDAVNTNINEE